MQGGFKIGRTCQKLLSFIEPVLPTHEQLLVLLIVSKWLQDCGLKLLFCFVGFFLNFLILFFNFDKPVKHNLKQSYFCVCML